MKDLIQLIQVWLFGVILLLLAACSSEDSEPPPPVPQAPSITHIEPDQGKFGDAITITGLNFGSTVAENTVTFNGLQAIVTTASETQLVAEVPRGAGSGPIEVVTDTGTAASLQFTYQLRAVVETVAGTGIAGFTDGAGEQAQFSSPRGLLAKPDGTLMIADANNRAVRKLINRSVSTVVVANAHRVVDVAVSSENILAFSLIGRAIAGQTPGFIMVATTEDPKSIDDFNTNNRSLIDPGGITFNKGGTDLYVTMREKHVILKGPLEFLILLGNHILGSYENPGNMDGSGETALLNGPSDIKCINNSNDNEQLFFIDQGNHSIRTVEIVNLPNLENSVLETPTTTLAGNGLPGFIDGNGDQAQFNEPTGLDLDEAGNIFVADFGNNAIRKITPEGEVTTILKSPGEVDASAQPQLIDGPEGIASFNGPYGIAVAPDGSLFVSDIYHHAIRRITFE